MPKDRVAALRKAFLDMTNDREFLAEAQKLDLDLDVMDGPQIDDILGKAYGSSPTLIEATRKAIGGS